MVKIFYSIVILGSAYSQSHKLVGNYGYHCPIFHLVTAPFFSLTSASCLSFSSKELQQKKRLLLSSLIYLFTWLLFKQSHTPLGTQRLGTWIFSCWIFHYGISVLNWALNNCGHSFHGKIMVAPLHCAPVGTGLPWLHVVTDRDWLWSRCQFSSETCLNYVFQPPALACKLCMDLFSVLVLLPLMGDRLHNFGPAVRTSAENPRLVI